MRAEELKMASPYEVLSAWQAGEISYRDAMDLTASESLFELYQACRSSGVPLRKELTQRELDIVEFAVADLEAEQ